MNIFDNLPQVMQKKITKAAAEAMRPGKKARSEREVAEAVCKAILKALMR